MTARTKSGFTVRDRRRWCHYRFGRRPTTNWGVVGDGGLPAPFAEGDVIEVPEGSLALGRMDDIGSGRCVVSTAFSISEADDWYFRVTKDGIDHSDRLHVFNTIGVEHIASDITSFLVDVVLIETSDPDGLALREQMLADGWQAPPAEIPCPVCCGTGRVTS